MQSHNTPTPSAPPQDDPPQTKAGDLVTDKNLPAPLSVEERQKVAELWDHPSANKAINKRRRTWRTVAISTAIFVAGFAAYSVFLFITLGKVDNGDLVEATAQNTRFLRPKQWQKIDVGTLGYGDTYGSDGKSTAMVYIKVDTTTRTGMENASDATYNTLREAVMEQLNDSSSVADSVQQDGDDACTSTKVTDKRADTATTGSTVGLYRLTVVCSRTSDEVQVTVRCVIGRDGILRYIAVGSSPSQWTRNSEAFNKILDSLSQTSAST